MKTYKKRDIYLKKILPFIDQDIIKVLIGQRRVGKSYILFQLMDVLKTHGVDEKNIIYINKELNEFDFLQDYNDLVKYVDQKNIEQKKYIFIDEVQDIKFFEKGVRDLFARGNDIYISGSNANLLSSEIVTYLSGRYIEFEIFPLNYQEFLDFHNLENSKDNFFSYLKFGGLPYLKNLELKQDIVGEYIKSVTDTIVLKDIVKRYNIRNVDFLEKLLIFLAENIGSLLTANNISKYLKSQKIDIATNVVLDYISYTKSVYLINKVVRQDIVGKKIFEINDKYYFSDIGIRNFLVGYKGVDIAKILENVVFQNLKTFGYELKIGKLGEKEIDFVAERNGEKKYIQVCYILDSQATKDREFGNLLAIKDNYEKIVLSLDDFAGGDYQGIKHYNIIDFLKDLE